MSRKPTRQEWEQPVKEVKNDVTNFRLGDKALFSEKCADSLLHPDWPEIKWNITGLFAHRRFLAFLIYLMKRLNISHVLDSFHGCPDLIWNGGRMNARVPFYPDTAEYFKSLNDEGKGVILTFSNVLLEEKHLSDAESNRLLECLDDQCGLNGVIVVSDLMSDYIRRKKPGLKQIASVVKSFMENPEGKVKWYREMQERFDRIVVHTDHMFDLDLLDKLDRGKAEILITEECSYKCPNRQRHQTLNSMYNVAGSKEVNDEIQKINKTLCAGRSGVLFEERNPKRGRTCFLLHDEVKAIYDMGFRNFKISGRRKPTFGLAWNVTNFVYNPALASAFARTFHDMILHRIRTDYAKMAHKKSELQSQP
jgi:collagenase-like PrtC family protease